MLKTFYENWYSTPNNAILLVAGDVDPPTTLAQIRALYGAIQRRSLPPRQQVLLRPVKQESFTLDSNLPYTLAFMAYRMPGTDSPDYAAARILADVLASQRGDLYALVPAGKALQTEFNLAETYSKASVGFALALLPAGTSPSSLVAEHDDHQSRRCAQGRVCRRSSWRRPSVEKSRPPAISAQFDPRARRHVVPWLSPPKARPARRTKT